MRRTTANSSLSGSRLRLDSSLSGSRLRLDSSLSGSRLRRRMCFACTSLASAALLILGAAPNALADYGRGWWGGINDGITTSFGLLLVAFFAVVVFVLSVLQWALDRRKKARKAAEKARLGDARWRGGW